MHTKRLLRTPMLALLGLLAVLIAPAAAQANHVNPNASSADCAAGTGTATLVVEFEQFSSNEKFISGTISLDGSPIRTFTANDLAPVVWNGADGTLTFTTGVLSGGSHTLTGDFTWPNQGSNPGTVTKTFTCPPPPGGTPPGGTPPGGTPPGGTPPGGTPPGGTPPGGTPPGGTPPSGGTLPETTVSGIARLRGPSGCVEQAFRARVSGRSIASVAFFVDGELVKRFTGKRARYSIKVRPARFGFGRHKVVARVTFVAGSGTQARALPLTFRRCAQGAVAPRFTG